MPPVKVYGDQNDLRATKDYPYAHWPYETFNPPQSRVLELYESDANCLIAASTSAGKTTMAEMSLAHEIRVRGGKGMYLGPLKALTQEKIDEWTHPDHHFNDLNISICTGDYRLTKDRRQELVNSNLIIKTTEMLNSRCRNYKSENNDWLKDVGTIVIDECFPGSTKVKITSNIELPIKRICEDDKITHVMAYDHCTNSVVKKKIIRKIKKERKKGLIRIKHENGAITCTASHKLWTENRGYVTAEELTDKDVLKWIPLSNDLSCSKCDKSFQKKGDLSSHYIYSHISQGGNARHIDDKKACVKCDKPFSVYGYESHIKSCGIVKKKRYIPKSKICKFCGKEFANASSRAKHETHHNRSDESYKKAVVTREDNPEYWRAMRQMGRKRRGKNNPVYTFPGCLEKLRKQGKERWKRLTEEEKIQQINRFIQAPKNKTFDTRLELFVDDVCQDAGFLNVRKTSGGKFWLTFKNGKKKNPDFKVKGCRKVIEVGDTEYWHSEDEILATVESYKEINFDCLYLTDKDVLQGEEFVRCKIDNFLNNHSSKVLEVSKWGRGGIDFVYDLEVEDCHNYFANSLLVSNCHLLTVPGRGDHLEAGLMKFTSINPNARIIMLSATMPNVKEIAEWVAYSLTNRETDMVQSNFRPCKLNIHYERYYDGGRSYQDNELSKVGAALNIIQDYPDDKFLMFTHTKGTGELAKKALKRDGIETEFHNADLSKEKRIELQNRFKDRADLRCLTATSGMAWGVNLPARRVIITGVHRGLSEVASYDVLQMVGRAGRVGLDPMGDAYILLPESKYDEWVEKLQTPEDIKSQMLDEAPGGHHKVLAFHIVSEIHHGGIKTLEDVHNWYERSLAHFQNQTLHEKVITKVMDLLIKCGAVKLEKGKYKCTSVGKISSMFYYSPFDIADLRKSFIGVFNSGNENNDIWTSMALGNTDTNRMGIVSKAEREEMSQYAGLVKKLFGEAAMEPAVKAGYAYFNLLNGRNGKYVAATQRNLQIDFPRMAEVLLALDSMACKWGKKDYFKKLRTRMVYGVEEHLVGLCGIPNIGKVRATKLYHAGLKTPEMVVANPEIVKHTLNMKADAVKKVIEDAAKAVVSNA